MPARSSSSKKHKDPQQGDVHDSNTAAGARSHWQSIRPWRPPEGLQNSSNSYEGEGYATTPPMSASAAEGDMLRIQVEVIDVASTAVALAIFSFDPVAPSHAQRAPSSRRTPSNSNTGNSAAAVPATTSLTVKLNSHPWPHVLHSDPAFFHDSDHPNAQHQPSQQQQQDGSSHAMPGAATVVIYGLDPGTSYQVELDWVREPETESMQAAEAEEDASALPMATRPITISTQNSSGSSTPSQAAAHDALYGPPPPYSSHDPSNQNSAAPSPVHSASSPASASAAAAAAAAVTAVTPSPALLQLRATEAELRSDLSALKDRVKAAETNLHAPLAGLKRSFEKAAKEDQRARQRISTLEEATKKLRYLAVEEAEQADALVASQVDPLSVEVADLTAKLEERRAEVHKLEVDAKKSLKADEDTVKTMETDLDETEHRIEGLDVEHARYHRDVLPDLTDRLKSLEDELRRFDLDQHRQQQHQQQQQQQFAAAAAASSWYNYAQQSTSNPNLQRFAQAQGGGASAPPQMAMYAGPSPTLQPTQSASVPPLNLQRAPMRQNPSSNHSTPTMAHAQINTPDWALGGAGTGRYSPASPVAPSPTSQLTAASMSPSALATASTSPPPPIPSSSVDSLGETLAAPAPASTGSRFLSGFRKRSTSSHSAQQPFGPDAALNPAGSSSDAPAKEGGKANGRPDSSGSGHQAKMSWSRVVGKGRIPAPPSS